MTIYEYVYVYTHAYVPKYGCWVVLFYGISTLFGSFKSEWNHFGWAWFYGISTIRDYLMPNPFLYNSISIIQFNIIKKKKDGDLSWGWPRGSSFQ